MRGMRAIEFSRASTTTTNTFEAAPRRLWDTHPADQKLATSSPRSPTRPMSSARARRVPSAARRPGERAYRSGRARRSIRKRAGNRRGGDLPHRRRGAAADHVSIATARRPRAPDATGPRREEEKEEGPSRLWPIHHALKNDLMWHMRALGSPPWWGIC